MISRRAHSSRALDRPDIAVPVVRPTSALRVQQDRVGTAAGVRQDDRAGEPVHEDRLVRQRLFPAARRQRAAVAPPCERGGVDERHAAAVRGAEVGDERVGDEFDLIERDEVGVGRAEERLESRGGDIRGLRRVPVRGDAHLRAGRVQEALELRDERVEGLVGRARARRSGEVAAPEEVGREEDLLRELRELFHS